MAMAAHAHALPCVQRQNDDGGTTGFVKQILAM
jgi:hypothetical protein